MELFAFHPELFEVRSRVLEMLGEHGFAWLSDFGSIDLLHDVYGLEVCGIREQSDARAIQTLVQRCCSWRHSRMYYKDRSTREPGWKVIVSRDPEDYQDNWQRVS